MVNTEKTGNQNQANYSYNIWELLQILNLKYFSIHKQ